MSNETRDLFQLGLDCYKQGKYGEARDLWEKGTDSGNWRCAYILAKDIYAKDESGMKSSENFLRALKALAYKIENGWGMIVLGSMLCGATHGFWRSFEENAFCEREDDPNRGGFRLVKNAFYEKELNPSEGLRLIENGLEIARGGGSPELDFSDYGTIADAYHNSFTFAGRKPDEKFTPLRNRPEPLIDLLAKAVYYKNEEYKSIPNIIEFAEYKKFTEAFLDSMEKELAANNRI